MQFNLISTKKSASPRYQNINIRPDYLTTVWRSDSTDRFLESSYSETDAKFDCCLEICLDLADEYFSYFSFCNCVNQLLVLYSHDLPNNQITLQHADGNTICILQIKYRIVHIAQVWDFYLLHLCCHDCIIFDPFVLLSDNVFLILTLHSYLYLHTRFFYFFMCMNYRRRSKRPCSPVFVILVESLILTTMEAIRSHI